MLNKKMVLNSIQQTEYDQIVKEIKLRRAQDRSTIFDRMDKDFRDKYGLDFFFFDENFFQSFANEYHELNKKAVDYYNETNRQISKARLATLLKYGYNSEKEYREQIAYDRSKEIIGLPNFLVQDTSLKIIKKKLTGPFVDYYNEMFLKKIVELFSLLIGEIKEGKINLITESGKNAFEEMLIEYQDLMFSFIYLRLNAEDVISFSKIAYGRLTVDKILESLRETLDYRDAIIMDYSGKEEVNDNWGKNIIKVIKDCISEYKLMSNEYEQNKQVVLTYNQDHNYERVQSELVPYDEKKYAYRFSIMKALEDRWNNRNIFSKMIALHEDFFYQKYSKMIPLRYINKTPEELNNDYVNREFKSQKTLHYEDLCRDIEEDIKSLSMMMDYTYQMLPTNYDVHMEAHLKELERDYRDKFHMNEDDYQVFEDNMIRENLGPEFLEGYDAENAEYTGYDDTSNY